MRVLLLSHTTGYQLRSFNDAADALGIEILFATDRCHKLDDPWQDRAIAVRFHDLDASVGAIVAAAAERPIDGLIAVGDRPVILAARAAQALGRRWHSVEGAIAGTDKRRARAAFAAAGLPSPRFSVLTATQTAEAAMRDPGFAMRDAGVAMRDAGPEMRDSRFPCVLKPLGLSGSRGVIRANDAQEFADAWRRIRALLARPQIRAARAGLEDAILVEEYIDGREFALEGVLTDGALRTLAIFDKPDPLEGPFFEETIYVTPSRLTLDAQARVIDHVHRATHALGLHYGPIHAECRVTAGGTIYVLEVAARPIGGLCSRVLTFVGADGAKGPEAAGADGADDASLEALLLRHAVGQSIDGYAREERAAAVMMLPIATRGIFKGVSGEDAARAVKGIVDLRITAKIGQLLEPLPEAGSYLGFVFARGATPEAAEESLRDAHRALTFAVARELVVEVGSRR